MFQPNHIHFSLPSWLESFVSSYQPTTEVRDRMAFVIAASQRNVEESTGGPFAAAVFEHETGKLVSLGVNLVTTAGLSILHAEMVAIAIAQSKLGTYDLGRPDLPSHELVSSTEPCAMCFGAVPWSGIRYLITGATDADARKIGFDEGPKLANWSEELEKRQITVQSNISRQAAAQVLNSYLTQGGRIYNSRESD